MKMFLSVFFGVFCGIIAAAFTLYTINDYQDTVAARQVLRESAQRPERISRVYEATPPAAESAPENKPATPEHKPMLIEPVTVKTTDGELTIPAGKVVRLANEKSRPGTVIINYEGYMITIPSSSIASTAR
jgi:hypothetical protein